MRIDSWMDDGKKACIVIEGQFFNAVCGSVNNEETDPLMANDQEETDTAFAAYLPMENKTYFYFTLLRNSTARVTLYHEEPPDIPGLIDIPCKIEQGVIRPKPTGGETEEERIISQMMTLPWEQEITSADELRTLLRQVGRMEVKP